MGLLTLAVAVLLLLWCRRRRRLEAALKTSSEKERHDPPVVAYALYPNGNDIGENANAAILSHLKGSQLGRPQQESLCLPLSTYSLGPVGKLVRAKGCRGTRAETTMVLFHAMFPLFLYCAYRVELLVLRTVTALYVDTSTQHL